MRNPSFHLGAHHISASTPAKWVACRAFALSIAVAFLGCAAEVRTARPVVAVEEEVVYAAPPAHVDAYPHVIYRGEPAYYVSGRWYTRRGPYWGYYRQPPPDLVRQRRYVEVAPPAHRYQPHPGEAIRVR